MKAKIKPRYDINRQKLADIIPLSTPFTILIEPTRYCNFKCFYCIHSTREEQRGAWSRYGYNLKHMEFEMYEKILCDITKFPERLKRVVFSGLGEPLMNPELPKMVARARELNIADRLDVVTNASLLTPELSDALIEAGVTRIEISLQGLNSEKYKEVSKINLNFEKFYENLRYLYKHKGNCTIFVKIIDVLLDSKEDENRFYELFGEISDEIYVEHLIAAQQPMGNIRGLVDNSRNLNSEMVEFKRVCAVIFYSLQIDVDGNVFPCCALTLPKELIIGNVKEEGLVQIWNGKKRIDLIKKHLKFNRNLIIGCSDCVAFMCATPNDKNEYLDDVAGDLLKRFE
ncbi:radical SAM/SPASM domain-containing protein [Anaerocellum danielii]|uniref:Radical SAM/SPASM domain-containing protein n=1 Tax=Anaerocellum danielii TaxID=1387557 RepID=A0ABZ0TY47_9FIRM|nr:radical SAM/SPASM domain-containing protein [Caldicellulosiruptor danielii]WPX07802.1 radical SAM/SPASM domain-containing protein [Caldicellulosiruptor danielii]